MKSANTTGAELARIGHRDKDEAHLIYAPGGIEFYANDDLVDAAFAAFANSELPVSVHHIRHRVTGQHCLHVFSDNVDPAQIGQTLTDWLANNGTEVITPPAEEGS